VAPQCVEDRTSGRQAYERPAPVLHQEMIDFETFISVGSMQAAKGTGQLRLEGKECRVADGDIITFRFHV